MIKRWIFLIVLIILAIVLFFNPNFKTIAAGVSILLFGMITLEEGFKTFTKGPLKAILRKATDKLYKSISLGALVTAFIQSSSLVSVITISAPCLTHALLQSVWKLIKRPLTLLGRREPVP